MRMESDRPGPDGGAVMGAIEAQDVGSLDGDQPFDIARVEAELRARLEVIHNGLVGQRNDWVTARLATGIEQRWVRWQELHDGLDSQEEGLKKTLTSGPTKRGRSAARSRVSVNIVRDKEESKIARLQEILLPDDEPNWELGPTAKPKLSSALNDNSPIPGVIKEDGTGATAADMARAIKKRAVDAAELMSTEINDALEECQFAAEERAVLRDTVLLGTGILKGPFPRSVISRSWAVVDGVVKEEVVRSVRPASKRVRPQAVYFDPSCGSDHQRGRGVIEEVNFTRRELRALIGTPGYIASAIKEVLAQTPKRLALGGGNTVTMIETKDGPYQGWEYTGEIEENDMRLLSTMAGDTIEAQSGRIIIVNDIVIAALEGPAKGDSLPYDVFVYEEDDDSPFGVAMGNSLDSQQRVATGAWRMLMDNGRHGPQIARSRNAVTPKDDDDEAIYAYKQWLVDSDIEDVSKAFAVFDVPSRLGEYLAIVKAAMEIAERESNTPSLQQGQMGAAPDLVRGMLMLMANASSPERQRVRRFDDKITSPHIRRYYDHFMRHSPDPAIKGDFQIVARGSGALIERDIQAAQSAGLINLAQSPKFGPHFKERWVLEMILKSFFKVRPDQVLEDEKEVERRLSEQPTAVDPKVEAAQIAAGVKTEEINDRKEQRAFEARVEEMRGTERAADRQYNREREQAEFEIAMTQEQNERYIALVRLQQERELTTAELVEKSALERLKIDNSRQIFNAEAALRVQTGAGI